jgi:ABC-2 type transport system permease protein
VSRALLVASRQLRAYFRSPLAAVIVAATLLLDGILFYWKGLGAEKLPSAEVLQQFFYHAGGVTAAAALFLSMGLLAEERQTGTFTLLNTAPIRDAEIVAGKFLAALAMIGVVTLLSLYMPALIFVNGKVSLGHIAVGYAGVLLYAGASAAIGLFASAVTRSQIIAVIVGGITIGVLIVLWIVAKAVDPPLNEYLGSAAFHHQNFAGFMNGVLELGPVVYYVAVTWFFLLAATKILEARRWR